MLEGLAVKFSEKKNICIVTVAFEGITPPHAPPGKNDGLKGGAYDHGLQLESNLANTQKRKQ